MTDQTTKLIFKSALPMPTADKPFAQIDYICNARGELCNTRSTQITYSTFSKIYTKYLTVRDEPAGPIIPYLIADEFSWDCHYSFYKWVSSTKSGLQLSMVRVHLVTLRCIIKYAQSMGYVKHECFFVTHKYTYITTTDMKTAYSDEIMNMLKVVVNKAYVKTKCFLDYKVNKEWLKIGRDPRIQPSDFCSSLLPTLDYVNSFTSMGFPSPTIREISSHLHKWRYDVKQALDFWVDKGVMVDLVSGPQTENFPVRKVGGKPRHFAVKCPPTPDEIMDADRASYGWSNIDNLIFYVLNCLSGNLPQLQMGTIINPDYKELYYGIRSIGGLKVFLNKVSNKGIHFQIPHHRLMATDVGVLMAKLAMITGLNEESIRMLRINAISTEPLSGSECLQYFKSRSRGHKSMPLFGEEDGSLYSDSLQSDTINKLLYFDLLPQASEVVDIIETAKKLTFNIRQKAPPDLIDRLFIYERADGIISEVSVSVITSATNYLRNELLKYLENSARAEGTSSQSDVTSLANRIKGESINLSKFRPTLATELVLAGAPLELVQAVLGHRRLSTTRKYLADHKLEVKFYSEITRALNAIKNTKNRKVIHVEDEVTLQEEIVQTTLSGVSSGFLYETGTPLFCRNPFDPSTIIKKSIKNWEDGKSVCTSSPFCK